MYSTVVPADCMSPDEVINSSQPDVVRQGCFCDFDVIACTRNGILSLFAGILTILCIYKIVRLHQAPQQYYHQLLVFYCATVECLIVIVHWVYIHYPQLELAAEYMKMLQLLIVCHFYLSRSVRLLRRDHLSMKLVLPALIAFFAYFSVVAVIAIVMSKDTTMECFDPYWVMMSAVEFFLTQLFLLAGILITKKMNEVTTLESARRQQKRNLWSIIIAFELSSLTTMLFDAVMLILNPQNASCADIYNRSQIVYSITYLFLMLFKIVVPIVTLLAVFHPVSRYTDSNQEDFLTSDTQYGAFQARFASPGSYRRLYQPGTEDHGIPWVPPSQYASPARRTQSFPKLPSIQEEHEPTSLSLPVTA
ncbi:uncharacterized protein LOC110990499 [Acanthaster planci]|uniref:Uncharacterized protein LOC110990499 n=1 Tax=Acanthaster planci TaxID=133434 RepID=A0A8B8A2N3_ACAPL|nr:uncharacterized protein LOC110990499 [Acanthaster planci]